MDVAIDTPLARALTRLRARHQRLRNARAAVQRRHEEEMRRLEEAERVRLEERCEKQLEAEEEDWNRMTAIIAQVMHST